jgi:hypothetical protein
MPDQPPDPNAVLSGRSFGAETDGTGRAGVMGQPEGGRGRRWRYAAERMLVI